MASLTSPHIVNKIINLPEVKLLCTAPEEKVLLVFFDIDNNIQILCGESCDSEWATIPPLNTVILWLTGNAMSLKECIIIHNHPGIPWFDAIIPSSNDITCTELLKWQFALLGINLVDHIIVAGKRKLSLLKTGAYEPGPIKINGFEIKRFLYCFLVQISVVFKEDLFLLEIISALEKNLDKVRSFYERPYPLRLFETEPTDEEFKEKLLWIKSVDSLASKLTNYLLHLDNGKTIKIKPGKILPYGMEMQSKIITAAKEKTNKGCMITNYRSSPCTASQIQGGSCEVHSTR